MFDGVIGGGGDNGVVVDGFGVGGSGVVVFDIVVVCDVGVGFALVDHVKVVIVVVDVDIVVVAVVCFDDGDVVFAVFVVFVVWGKRADGIELLLLWLLLLYLFFSRLVVIVFVPVVVLKGNGRRSG